MGVAGSYGDKLQSNGTGGFQWAKTTGIHVGATNTPTGRTTQWTSLPDKLVSATLVLDGIDVGADVIVQIGDADGFKTTGYKNMKDRDPQIVNGFWVGTDSSTEYDGFITLTHAGNNVWVMASQTYRLGSGNALEQSVNTGRIKMSKRLDRIKVVASENMSGGSIGLQWTRGK